MSNVIVLFTKGYNGFNEGEIVGFDPDYAAQLISMKVAKTYVPPSQVVQPAAAPLEPPNHLDRAMKEPTRKRGGK